MSLTLESIKIFCDVVKLRNFSKAGILNGVTQSAASQAVSHIEKRLGVSLLDRSKRPFGLTFEGELYYKNCREMIKKYFALEADLRASNTEARSTFIIASIYSIGLHDMNQNIKKFQDLYPKGQIKLHYLHPKEVVQKVMSEEADLGIISFPHSIRDIEIIPLREEPMVVACHPSHPLWNRKEVFLNELEGENFVAFDMGLDIRRKINTYLRDQKIHVNIMMEFDNTEAIKRAVEAGSGISLLPKPTLNKETNSGTLRGIPLVGPKLCRPISIIHKKSLELQPPMKSFIEILKGDMSEVFQEKTSQLEKIETF